ncbi:dehydrogenase [Streptomyces sp. NPDC000345]|uniref:dehydrogenase n=1 Tax=Streptomyces sp. NPDC000345 TaxID=3364537 RepID=UPI0036872B7A
MSDEATSLCPRCGGPLTTGAMVLCGRKEDGRRVCRVVSRRDGRHVWWRGADGLYGGLEPCPDPKLFAG